MQCHKKENTIEELVKQTVKEILAKTNEAEIKIEPIITQSSHLSTMDYSNKTREELITLCKEKNIKGYSGKKKDDIIQLLINKLPVEVTPNNAIVQTNIVDIIPKTDITKIKYIDLFCGIGGFHQALAKVIPSSSCVFTSKPAKRKRSKAK